MEYFISHASEDKQDFVRDLANHLIRNGTNVFYDEYSIKLGDSLFDKINEGIKESKNCIIVFSKYFFEKNWTMAELKAIFGMHISGRIKIIGIYHNIEFEEVQVKYPLLSDILGVNSDIGYEKVAEKIFEATGYTPKLSYGKIAYPNNKNGDISNEGFHILMRFSLPRRINPKIPKVVFETGTPQVFHSRARLVILNNARLYLEIETEDYKKVSISMDITHWDLGESHVVIGNLNTRSKTLTIYDNGKQKSEMKYKYLKIPNNLFDEGGGIFGCSLELDYPCPFEISFQSVGKSLTKKQVTSLSESVEEYNKSIGR